MSIAFFYTGDIFAFLQSCGSVPVSSENWKTSRSPWASSSAQVFSTMSGMLSGPIAFDVIRFVRSFNTPFFSMFRCGMVGIVVLRLTGGREVLLSLVKTD